METKIPNNINDLLQKGIFNLFQSKAISFFGFKLPKIAESLNVELIDIKIEEKKTDLSFLLEDDTILHFEFQTDFRLNDISRFLLYDVLVYEQHKRRAVTTVIIYAAGVRPREVALNFKTLTYQPYTIFLEERDGDAILKELEEKVSSGEVLNEQETLNLIFNYFMKSDIIEKDRAKRLVNLAIHIPDRKNREMAFTTIYGISSKFLDEDEMKKLSEVFMMADPWVELLNEVSGGKIFDLEKVVEAKDKLIKEKDQKLKQKDFETARKLLMKNVNIDIISEATNLDPDTISELIQ